MVCYHILLHPRALLRLGLLKLTFLSFSILLLYHLHHTSQATLSLTAKPNLTTPGPRNLTAELENKNLNWDQYKYVQVVSTADELCSAVMIWNQIEGVGSRAGRIMIYPSTWPSPTSVNSNITKNTTVSFPSTENENETIQRLLQLAVKKSFVSVHPHPSLGATSPFSTNQAYGKLLAYNLTVYSRVLVLSPSISVREQLDEVFLIPEKDTDMEIAMPYTYLQDEKGGSWGWVDGMILLRTSAESMQRVENAIQENSASGSVSDIMKKAFKDGEIRKLNPAEYGFLTSSLRYPPLSPPSSFLQTLFSPSPPNSTPKLNPLPPLSAAKIIHFSDDPAFPPPWLPISQKLLNKYMPKCKKSEFGFGASDCKDRQVWLGLYREYRERREAVCGADFAV